MAKRIIFDLFILSFLALSWPAEAAETTNKFGIHILEPTDLPKARELANSSGGDWGFVTIVIRDDDRHEEKWQKFFDECRKFHLVPMVRMATHLNGDTWVKPTLEDIDFWADFLVDLNWPIKNKYVVVLNEPNHKKEWGGEVNPRQYTQILLKTIEVFKARSPDFQILNAGFDLAAGNSSQTMEALEFWRQMEKESPGIFSRLDGWASHSYPNHGYIGTPAQSGRTSIRGYQWELEILKNRFKVVKDLPVFITETGWPYQDNLKFKISNLKFYSPEITAKYIRQAFENVWLPDTRVMAVTPFVLYYPQPPFENFSWITKENQVTPQYLTVQELPKVSWWPEQEFGLKLEKITLPPFLPTATTFEGKLQIRNVGQSIWGERGPLEFLPKTSPEIAVDTLKTAPDLLINPGEVAEISFTVASGTVSGEFSFSWEHFPEFKMIIVPSGTLARVRYTFWQKIIFWLEEKLLF